MEEPSPAMLLEDERDVKLDWPWETENRNTINPNDDGQGTLVLQASLKRSQARPVSFERAEADFYVRPLTHPIQP